MGQEFDLHSNYKPSGDQPTAIRQLVEGVQQGKKHLTKQEAWKLKKAELARKDAEEKAAIAERRMVKSVDAIQAQEKKWRENAAELKKQEEAISINEAVMEENNEEIKAQENKIASINEQIKDKNVELQDVSNEIEQAVYGVLLLAI